MTHLSTVVKNDMTLINVAVVFPYTKRAILEISIDCKPQTGGQALFSHETAHQPTICAIKIDVQVLNQHFVGFN